MTKKLLVSILLACFAVGARAKSPSDLLPDGPLSTHGSQIVDANGQPVRIVSVGAWDPDIIPKVAEIRDAGFNTVRFDWSNRALGSKKLHELDEVLAAARRVGLKVILDDHSNEAGAPGPWKPCYAQQENGLWYDLGGASDNTDGCHTPGTVTDARFIQDWQTVARHFKDTDTVIGYDLWNEPSGYPGMSTWEPGDRNPTHNIRYMCERAGAAILTIDPNKLIICEAPMNAQRSYANPAIPAPWGDLSIAGKVPVKLPIPNKLVYSVHDYPTEIGGYKPDHGAEKVSQMNLVWGYLVRDHITPVWIGEMGANMRTDEQRAWAQTLIDYTNGKLGAIGGPTFAAGEQGVGIDWWFAGHSPYGNPTGIFDEVGGLDGHQQVTYQRLAYRKSN
jgi:endoglucanase